MDPAARVWDETELYHVNHIYKIQANTNQFFTIQFRGPKLKHIPKFTTSYTLAVWSSETVAKSSPSALAETAAIGVR